MNASSTGGVFKITAKNVTINNLNFINQGYYEHNGVVDQGYYGAINWQASYGTLINCNFTDCTSYGAGGAILWAHDYGNIINCNFVNCRSYEGGGAISWSSYEGNISNCNFTNCNSFGLYQFGGAINNWNSKSKISNCNFLVISALNGAAIYSPLIVIVILK